MTQQKVNWAIIGPGAIANNFALGIQVSANAQLVAVAGRSIKKINAFADLYDVNKEGRFESIDELLASDVAEAVYISTPHTSHAQLAIKALRKGKHVLCEKPIGLNEAQVRAITHVAAEEQRFLMEGYMYLCHPQIQRLIELIVEGKIGDVQHIESSFCFNVPYDHKSRLYDPKLAGGGILDIGGYPVSFARLVVGTVLNCGFAEPVNVKAVARKAPSGVDATSITLLEFANGITAQCRVAVDTDAPMTAIVHGTKGSISFGNAFAPGRDAGPSNGTITLNVGKQTTTESVNFDDILFALEAQQASAAILKGQLEPTAPAMGWQDSIGNAQVLQKWRDEIAYELIDEKTETSTALTNVISSSQMPKSKIEGVKKEMSKLVMGCDNQERASDGAVMWDAWLEAGGNAFDTAFVYSGGVIEHLLGQWIKARNVRDEIVLTVKGCHTPCCDPVNMKIQLSQSFDRLGVDYADLYIMHRDNLDIPVGEFVDALDELASEGLIGPTGGSNWSTKRLVEANEWAKANKKRLMTILNNNLSLAVMEKPIWDGCISSNNKNSLEFLNQCDTVHLSWSSQARGYFLAEQIRGMLPEGTGPEQCYKSLDNEKRRERAEELATQKNVNAGNIALAWVLSQKFQSFALVGPRSPSELAAILPALNVELSEKECAWLNLQSDSQ